MGYASGDGGGKKPNSDSLIGGAGEFARTKGKEKLQEKLDSFKPGFLSNDEKGNRFKPGGIGGGDDDVNKDGKAYKAGHKIGQDIKQGAQAVKNVAKPLNRPLATIHKHLVEV